MRLPLGAAHTRPLRRRDDDRSPNRNGMVVVSIIVIVVLVIAIVSFLIARALRARRAPPKYLPGNWLKQRWRSWTNRYGGSRYSSSLQLPRDRSRDASPPASHRISALDREMDITNDIAASGANNSSSANNNGVDRNTSVRSVMTLPAYSPMARPTEQILGREGERGGIDTVLEFPEGTDEEEAQREEEMESLYQIRLARRQEQAEREERRRQRREARARGDFEALEQLRRESRQRAESLQTSGLEGVSTAQQLIAEHQARRASRERRVSSVQYGDLGVARHDGTRLRANSSESDHRPLLDSAASMGGRSSPAPSGHSRLSINPFTNHNRGRSASSVVSLSTADDGEHTPGTPHRRFDSSGSNETRSDFEIVNLSQSRSPSATRSITSGSDLGESRIPPMDPSYYEDMQMEGPPEYTSPIQTRPPSFPASRQRTDSPARKPTIRLPTGAPQIPNLDLDVLPAIQVTPESAVDEFAPARSRAGSPGW